MPITLKNMTLKWDKERHCVSEKISCDRGLTCVPVEIKHLLAVRAKFLVYHNKSYQRYIIYSILQNHLYSVLITFRHLVKKCRQRLKISSKKLLVYSSVLMMQSTY